MAIPSYNARPISLTFLASRALQLTFLFTIIGMTASFVNAMVMANHSPSPPIVGALVITCLATLYTLLSLAFYWAPADRGLFMMSLLDTLLFLAFLVVSVSIGKPVASLNCYWRFENVQGDVLDGLVQVWNRRGSTVDLLYWSGMDKGNCFETKAIWGLCIGLTILYSVTAMLLPALWFKSRKAGPPGKVPV